MSNSAFSQSAAPSSFADLTGVPDDNAALAAALAGKADAVPYFEAVVNQSGTDDPVLTILHNDLGGTPTMFRDDMAVYVLVITGAFTSDKTTGYYSRGTVIYNDADKVYINNLSGTDTIANASLLIKVYP